MVCFVGRGSWSIGSASPGEVHSSSGAAQVREKGHRWTNANVELDGCGSLVLWFFDQIAKRGVGCTLSVMMLMITLHSVRPTSPLDT